MFHDITGKIKRDDSATDAIASVRITKDSITDAIESGRFPDGEIYVGSFDEVDPEIASFLAKPPMSKEQLRQLMEMNTVSFTTLDTTLSRIDNTATIEAWRPEPQPPRRLRCEYCGCLAEKDYGNCDHCGAPL